MTELYTLSPSTASRWMNCPGSQHICAQLPPLKTTDAAQEGTLAHTAAAWAMYRTLSDCLGVEPDGDVPPEPEAALLTEEMMNGAQTYADSVLCKLGELGIDDGALYYGIEHKVSFESQGVSIRGRLDFFAYGAGTLVIVDYKFGGTPVPVKDNPQLLAYAVCMTSQIYNKLRVPVEKLVIGIVQPRSEITDFGEHGAMWYTYRDAERGPIMVDILEGAGVACKADDKTPRATGEHCRYCPARSVCRAAVGERLLLACIAAGEAEMRSDATDEQIGAWLTALKKVDEMREDLTRIAKARMSAGNDIPGWRLQTRRTRQWREEYRGIEHAAELAVALGLTEDDVVLKSLITPAAASKAVPKDTVANCSEEVVQTALAEVRRG